jgi:DNA-binding NtrC family response regulator
LPDCATSRLGPSQPLPPFLCFDELERRAISDALKRSCNKKMQAAELLGIDYTRFKRKLEKHGL